MCELLNKSLLSAPFILRSVSRHGPAGQRLYSFLQCQVAAGNRTGHCGVMDPNAVLEAVRAAARAAHRGPQPSHLEDETVVVVTN